MKKIISYIFILFSLYLHSQTYLMPNDTDASDPATINTCTGNFYDAGGDSAFYPSDQNAVMTFCTDGTDPAEKIRMSFTAIHLSSDGDHLNVYDGPDTTAPLLTTINSVQNNSSLTVEATNTNASGCLTFEFISDNSSEWHGWQAEVSCFVPCQNITPSIDSTNPAPSGGTINVGVGDTVTFQGSATFSNSGAGATYSWDFGDGNTATGTDVSNTFNSGGTYTVTFTVTDDGLPQKSDSQKMNINVTK